MRSRPFALTRTLVLFTTLSANLLLAQAPARRPAPPPVNSPEVHADHRVTFRLRAPTANKVTVSGQFQKAAATMAKNDDGLWTVAAGLSGIEGADGTVRVRPAACRWPGRSM
ncbi:MAG: hypothetical protein Q7S40_08875 [Opitutaceae bacterium]|nr:hypothetical protein [Opitutaceae bacterium]